MPEYIRATDQKAKETDPRKNQILESTDMDFKILKKIDENG